MLRPLFAMLRACFRARADLRARLRPRLGGAITAGITITPGDHPAGAPSLWLAPSSAGGIITGENGGGSGRRVQSPLLSRSKAISLSSKAGISLSGTMFGPSEKASSGRSCVSMNRPATPTATAARARTGTNSRWPPEDVPCPPGCCTLWVASKITGAPICSRHDRQAAKIRDQRIIAKGGAALGHQHVRDCRRHRFWPRHFSCPRAPETGPS